MRNFFGDIPAAKVQNVGHIFENDRYRRHLFDYLDESLIEGRTRIYLVRVANASNRREFGPTDSRECLTWQACD